MQLQCNVKHFHVREKKQGSSLVGVNRLLAVAGREKFSRG